MRETGMPVQRDTTPAMSSAVISSFKIRLEDCSFFSLLDFCSRSFSNAGRRPYRISAAFAKSVRASAISASMRNASSSFLIVLISTIVSFSFFHLSSSSEVPSLRSALSFSIFAMRSLAVLSVSFFRASRSISRRMILRRVSSSWGGMFSSDMRNEEAASSMRSTTLSGKNRSVI